MARSVVIVARGTESYGVLTKLTSLGEELSRRGWSVTAYSVGEGEYADRFRAILRDDVVVEQSVPETFNAERYGRLVAYARVLKSSFAFGWKLRRFIRRSRFDAALFCEHGMVLPIAASVMGLDTKFFWLMPNIVSDNYPADINRRLYGIAFKLSGMVPVGNSAYTLTTLGTSGAHGSYINLGVDPKRFDQVQARPTCFPVKVDPAAVHLLIAARMHPEKGQLQMVEALLSHPDLAAIHLILCGGPLETPYAQSILAAAERLGGSHRLHMLGSFAETAPFYALADVVASVRIDPEPFGLSIVEAMHSAKPVLAHRLGGPDEIVVDGETGWLIDDMAEESLVLGLRRMLSSRDRWPEMGRAAQRRAQELYTVSAMTTQVEAVITKHLNRILP